MLGNLTKTQLSGVRNGLLGITGVRYGSTGIFQDKDLEMINKNFKRSDKNLDYLLDMWEFNNFTKFTLGRRLNEIDLIQLFTLLDGDKDGQVSQTDVVKHLEKRFKIPTSGNLEYAFCTYDKDDDGLLYLHEFRQALYFLGFPGGHKKIRDIFKKYDTDRDYMITFHQFEKIVKEELPAMLNL